MSCCHLKNNRPNFLATAVGAALSLCAAKGLAQAPATSIDSPLQVSQLLKPAPDSRSSTTQPASAAPATSSSAALPANASQPYVDRVIEPGTIVEDSLELKASAYNASGLPRSIRVDYSIFSQKGSGSSISRAIGIGGFIDTTNYGVLSLNANLLQQKTDPVAGANADPFAPRVDNRASTWRIDQRRLPLDGGWFANHSAGDINTVGTSLARGLGRVSLPGASIRGLSAQWQRAGEIEINASAGRAGSFSGFDVAGFEPERGTLLTAGGQFRLPTAQAKSDQGRFDAALQVIEGNGIGDVAAFSTAAGNLFSTLSDRTQDTRAIWVALAFDGRAPWASGFAGGNLPTSDRVGGLRVQANFARSSATLDGSALGAWIDAAWRTERWRNSAGVFRFEPNLRWGAQVLASDLQGVYWQADTSTRQWQAGYAVEVSDRVSDALGSSGAAGRSVFANANARYRLDSRNSIGASVNVRAISSPGEALLLNWDRASDWGQTQWRGDFAHTADARTTRFGVDHSWPLVSPATLNTSLAWERTRGGAAPATALIWGVLGAVSPHPQWSIDAALRGAARSDKATSLSANVGVTWQSFLGWSLGLRYTEARGREPLEPLVVSALTAAVTPLRASLPTNRSLQLVLRYEARAGSATVPLGGAAGSGAGSIGGSVFYDGDSNGRREATEGGVAGVTVILDRIYVTKSDAQGRYEFPNVAPGEHFVEVSSDNVPLPWSPALREPVKTSVTVRQFTIQNFAVQRDR